MWECDDLRAWAALVRAPGLDVYSVSGALDLLGSAAALMTASDAERTRASLPAAARAYLSSRAAIPTAAERAWLEPAHHHLIPFTDPRYPPSLLALPDCPLALYVSGSAEALSDPQLAIVGSRCPTPQGRETARTFAA
ncbi:MAG: hypothetical protein JWN43_1202, partial [Gammaproteobacteria bacterium]|nr:hypothetical protein [Gammaproteobacteria bacterium]